MQSSNDLPPRYLRTDEAARFLGPSPRTLEKHRQQGTGPLFRKLVGRVVYEIGHLQQWVDQRARRATSDPDSSPGELRTTRDEPSGE